MGLVTPVAMWPPIRRHFVAMWPSIRHSYIAMSTSWPYGHLFTTHIMQCLFQGHSYIIIYRLIALNALYNNICLVRS